MTMGQMSLFDMFEDFGLEEPVVEEKKEEKKAEVKPEKKAEKITPFPVDSSDNADSADEEEDLTDDSATTDDGEKESKKPVTKVRKTYMTGPIKIVGTGWTFDYGSIGEKIDIMDALKAAFNEGFKEVALASITRNKDESVLYVSTLNERADDDATAMGKELTIYLARKAAVYKAEDFPGLDPDEISLGDVLEKYYEAYPELKGCSLKTGGGIAVPVLTDSYTLKKDSADTVKIWKEDGVIEYNEGEASLLFEGCTVRKSDSDVLFPVYSAKAKGSSRVSVSLSDFGLTKGTSSTVKEKYTLPFTLYLETFGQRREMKPEDFNGKTKVTKDEVIDYLKPKYKAFQSKKRKFDVVYEKSQDLVSVALISGEKGAAVVAAFPAFTIPRIENTDIGLFSGEQTRDGLVTGLDFALKLPKIPRAILNVIVAEFKRTGETENMLQVYWSNKNQCYYVKRPEQVTDRVSVRYKLVHSKDTLVLTVHSHNRMNAFFSSVDDADEVYTGLFGVIGNVDRPYPSMRFRAGMEGCFKELSLNDLFESEVA